MDQKPVMMVLEMVNQESVIFLVVELRLIIRVTKHLQELFVMERSIVFRMILLIQPRIPI